MATEPTLGQKVILTYMIGGTNWIGLSVPLHCSALDKVLLAHGAAPLSPGRLERRADKTVTIHAVLEADLADARSRGYAVTDRELKPGLIAVAAPVYQYDGTVVAAISASWPTIRLARDRVIAAAARCVQEAAGLSAELGYRPQEARTAQNAGAA